MAQTPRWMTQNETSYPSAPPPLASPPVDGGDKPLIPVGLVSTAVRLAPLSIAAFVLAGLILGTLVSVIVKPKYAAVTELLIDPRGLQLVERDLTARSQATDAMMAVVESYSRIITSDTVLSAVIEKEHLDSDPEFAAGGPGFASKLKEALFGASSRLAVNGDNAVLDNLRQAVSAKRAERSYVIEIGVKSTNPDKSARLSNAVAAAFTEVEIAARADSARKAAGSLSSRLDELRQRVTNAENDVEAYKAKNNIVGVGGRLVSEQQLSDLNTQLATARARTAELKTRTEQVERARKNGGDSESTSEAVQSQTVGLLRGQQADLKRQENELLATLGPRHPNLLPIREQLRGVQTLINEELARIARMMKSEADRAQANEDALAKNLDKLKTESLSTSAAFVRLRELEREVDASRAVYESFLKRSREIGEQEQIDSSNIRVLSPALPPLKPSGVQPIVFVLAGAVVGLMLGMGSAVLRAFLMLTRAAKAPVYRPQPVQGYAYAPGAGYPPSAFPPRGYPARPAAPQAPYPPYPPAPRQR